MHRTRSAIAAGVVLALGLSSAADARTGDPLREGARNGTTTRQTQIISNIGNGYSTRQSNKSTTGGGAIYGCRSTSATTSKACIRANNLSTGRAFEFATASGLLGGLITVGTGGDSRKPFTTNATGVATGLNADRVDSLNAADIVAASRAKTGLDADTVDGLGSSQLRTRWALINEAGAIEEQSGGFTVTSAYANANVYINAGESLADNGLTATVAVQTNIDRGGGAGANPSFGGSVAVSRCATAATTCGPAGTNDANHLVVAPRVLTSAAAGTPVTFGDTTPATRLRFYVTVTE